MKRSLDENALAVTLDEVKEDLRVDSADEDITITALIQGMTDFFEARTGWRLAPAGYRAELLGCIPCKLTIERGPLRIFEAVMVWNTETRQWDELDSSKYTYESRGREFDIYFEDDAFEGYESSNRPLRVDFSAGFDSPGTGETAAVGAAEAGMIIALKACIAQAYQNKESGMRAGGWAGEDPAKDFVLRQYRKFW